MGLSGKKSSILPMTTTMRLLFFLFFVASQAVLGFEDDRGHLWIMPNQNGVNAFVFKEGDNFVLTCAYNSSYRDLPSEIAWHNEDNSPITTDPYAAVRVYRKPSEVIMMVNKVRLQDAGFYTCQAKVLSTIIRSPKINVKIIRTAKFHDERVRVGGMRGEVLKVDCSASGDPPPTIRISDDAGLNFPSEVSAERYVSVGDELTIRDLKEADQDKKVLCYAEQMFAGEGVTNVEEKRISIDVWYPPEMSKRKLKSYAIQGRNATMICEVNRSNPPLTEFSFYKDSRLILHGGNYRLITDLPGLRATLHILETKEEDFGTYQCNAQNSQAKSEIQLTLEPSMPPGSTKGALVESSVSGLRWRLRAADGESELPVTAFMARYLLSDELDRAVGDPTQLWEEKARAELLPKKSSEEDLYDVDGLRPNAMYVFRFSAVNEAGEGDPLEIRAETVPSRMQRTLAPSSSASSSVYFHFLSLSLLLLSVVQ